MSRLIDADALIKDFDKRCFGECCCCIESTNTESGCKVIDEQPTVDAVPVVHGKWVFSENDDMFYCTNCKNGSVRNDYPYCHWCGAVMDGEKEKE